MRRTLVIAAFALVLTSLAPSSAQPPQAAQQGFDVEQRLAEITARVGLDATQQAQARTILTDARNELEQARAAAARGTVQMPEQRRAILFRAEDRLWAILTCAQKDAFRLYVRERMLERRERRAEVFGPPPGPRGRGGRGRR